MENYFVPLNALRPRQHVGNKAHSLLFLHRHQFAVPVGWVCLWDARTHWASGDPEVLPRLRKQLTLLVRNGQAYAVRSSANVEDGPGCSFAGQFTSILGVSGVDDLLDAVIDVWRSADAPEVAAYQGNVGNESPLIEMAVIVQEMVDAVWSGVAFSKNPMTGLSETIVEGGQGTGGQGERSGRSPERWVRKWGQWQHRPDTPLMPEALAEDIARQTAAIARKYGEAVDVEWAYDGKRLYFVQVRGITRLDIPVYSNRISREMLPGIIKPLVWSVNTRLTNACWTEILGQLTGDHGIPPESLTGHFYHRAYFNMSVFGRAFEQMGMPYEALELLMGMESEGPEKPHMRPGIKILRRLPGIVALTVRLLAIEKELDRVLKRQEPALRSLERSMEGELTLAEWMEIVDRLQQETIPVIRMNILVPLMGMMYSRMLGSLLRKNGIDARNLDTSAVQEAAEEYRPHIHMERLRQKYFAVDRPLTDEEQKHFKQDFADFLQRFGHFSDSGNDFSSVPWREIPELIRQMIEKPVAVPKQPSGDTGPGTLRFDELKLPTSKRGTVRWFYRRSCRFAIHREAISSLYTFGHGLFRTCFLALGGQLASRRTLDAPIDIFNLYLDEVRELVHDPDALPARELIRKRIEEMDSMRDIPLPETIYGSKQPPVAESRPAAWKGIPTSLGAYTGIAKILRGLSEFDRLSEGDVLVIPFSDVGWTPLFGKAGAVVAESGGMLSHSSIMAREYRIPAVVSVPGACLIPEGSIVTVNGYTGEIHVEQKVEAVS